MTGDTKVEIWILDILGQKWSSYYAQNALCTLQ